MERVTNALRKLLLQSAPLPRQREPNRRSIDDGRDFIRIVLRPQQGQEPEIISVVARKGGEEVHFVSETDWYQKGDRSGPMRPRTLQEVANFYGTLSGEPYLIRDWEKIPNGQ